MISEEDLPNRWEILKLNEVLESIENGNRPKGGIKDLKEGIPSLGGEHLNSSGGFKFEKIRLVTRDFYDSLKRGKIKKRDVLVVKDGATTGKTSFVNDNFPYQEAAVNEHVFILRGKEELLDQKFLFYHMFSPIGQIQIAANFRGAAIGGINTQFVKNYKLVIPPLETQKKIVEILERAEKMKEWRAEADELTDEFLKSVFLEMFGDPAINPKKWNIIKLKTVYSKNKPGTKCGPFGSALKKHEYVDSGIPVWIMDNIRGNEFVETGCLYVTTEKFKKLESYSVEAGDIIISRAGTVGKMCIVSPSIPDSIISTNLIRLSLDQSKIQPIYFTSLMTYFKGRVGNLKTGQDGSYTFMNTKVLNDLKIPLPPIELQDQSAEIVKQVKTLKIRQKQSKHQIDTLFNALMQKAFKGELVC